MVVVVVVFVVVVGVVVGALEFLLASTRLNRGQQTAPLPLLLLLHLPVMDSSLTL